MGTGDSREEVTVVLVRAPRGAESATILHPCAGVVDVSQVEVRVTLFDEGLAAINVIPVVEDELEIGSERYAIVEIEREPRGYACRCRTLPGLSLGRGKTVSM